MQEIKRIERKDGATLHIINRGTQYDPYVVCWNYNGREWDWGTYCHTIQDAMRIFEQKRVDFEF